MNNFRTRIDVSNNRQFKHLEKTNLNLSGITFTGLEYHELSFGADPYFSGVTEEYFSLSGTFSGNSIETDYYFPDSRMGIVGDSLPIITTSYSASTFNSGDIFVGYNPNVIDGEIYYNNYSGVNYQLTFLSINEPSPNIYTGNFRVDNLKILSANSIDWNSRRIWLHNKGIIKTENLILTSGASLNQILYIKNNEGDVGGIDVNNLNGTDVTFGDQTLSSQTISREIIRDINYELSGQQYYLTFKNLSSDNNLFVIPIIEDIEVYEGTIYLNSVDRLNNRVDKFYLVIKNGVVGFLGDPEIITKSNFTDGTNITYNYNRVDLTITFNYDTKPSNIILNIKQIKNNI